MSHQPLNSLHPDNYGPEFLPSFQREMNRLLDHFRSGFPIPETAGGAILGPPEFPAIDIVETDNAVHISAEVPGVRQEDLEATISGGILTLEGKKSPDHEATKDCHRRVERRYGAFRRQIPLGFSPEDGAVDASCRDGILRLDIAKPASAKAEVTKINITKS